MAFVNRLTEVLDQGEVPPFTNPRELIRVLVALFARRTRQLISVIHRVHMHALPE